MTSITKIHHINFLVSDLTESCKYLSKILDQTPKIFELTTRGVITAQFCVGEQHIVLVQPLSMESSVGKILLSRGEGLFLLSLEVDDLSNALDNLEKRGILASENGQRAGLHDWIVQDLNVPSSLGPVLQLCQVGKCP